MDDYYEKILRSAHTFLSRWNGADALIRELTFSHMIGDTVRGTVSPRTVHTVPHTV